jgi:hypothetical protein
MTWSRMDQVNGLDVLHGGWDSTMACYPFVILIDGQIVMFYNGNGFGQTGFGYAVLDQEF